MIRSVFLVACILLSTLAIFGQIQDLPSLRKGPAPATTPTPAVAPAAQQEPGDFTLNVDVELVQLPVLVFDKEGKLIDNLAQSHFQIFEDGVKQEIKLFRHEDNPISVGMVIDNSGSMRNKRARVNGAALSFVRGGNPDDETFIVNFDDTAYLEQDFTGSLGDLVEALSNIDPRGETALNDAVYLSIDHVKMGKWEKKALLVISDGEDNVSKYGFNKVLEHLRDAKDVSLYAIGLLEENDTRGGLFGGSPTKKAKEELTKLAEATGGQAYFPKSVDEVQALCQQIAHNLRSQYTIGYTPTNSKQDGAFRQLKVVVTPPDKNAKITVRTKPGYNAPGGTPGAVPPAAPASQGSRK
jgi:Ca-activated chloride channel family protein